MQHSALPRGAPGTRRRWPITALLIAIVLWQPALWAAMPNDLPRGVMIPAYAPGPAGFHPGDELRYRVTWSGLPVAFANVTLRVTPGHPADWLGDVLVSTNKLVDIFYRMRANLEDHFAAQNLLSQSVTIRQRENERESEYSIRFDRRLGLVEASRRTHKGVQTQRYLARHPVGPVSGALLALSQPLAIGDHLVFDCFAGTSRYVFAFDVKAHAQLATDGGVIPVLRIEPNLVFLSAGRDHYRVEQVVVYVTDDRRHTPLRIIADTFVGRIYVDLIGSQRSASSVAN